MVLYAVSVQMLLKKGKYALALVGFIAEVVGLPRNIYISEKKGVVMMCEGCALYLWVAFAIVKVRIDH